MQGYVELFLLCTSKYLLTDLKVAQLYRKTDVTSVEAMELGKWGIGKKKRLKVKIRELEVVVEAPRPL